MLDRNDKLYLTSAERLVMRIIWLSDQDLVLNEILSACNRDYDKEWKPQTVSTYLSHLVQKGFLSMERHGKYCRYTPLVPVGSYLAYDIQNFASYWGIDRDILQEKVKEASDVKTDSDRSLAGVVQ